MDFRDTKLPADPMILKAYMAYTEYQKKLAPEVQALNNGLRVAQLLNETTDGDNKELISFALLRAAPAAVWGLIEKRFGEKIVSLKEEVASHTKMHLTHLAFASDPAQIYVLASVMTGMENIVRAAKSAGTVMEETVFGAPKAMRIAEVPDTGVYQMIIDNLRKSTSAPKLEKRFQEMVNLMRETREGQIKMMQPQQDTGITFDASFRFPAFEKTSLTNDPQIRGIYNAIAADARTRPEEFKFAVQVAEILSTVPALKSLAAIAGALINLGLPGIKNETLDKLKTTDLKRVLGEADYTTHEQSRKTFADMRQITVGIAVARIDHEQKNVEEFLSVNKNSPKISAPSFDAAKKEILKNVQLYIQEVRGFSLPQAGTPVSPELENIFRLKLRELASFVDMNTPKQTAAPKPQSFRKP